MFQAKIDIHFLVPASSRISKKSETPGQRSMRYKLNILGRFGAEIQNPKIYTHLGRRGLLKTSKWSHVRSFSNMPFFFFKCPKKKVIIKKTAADWLTSIGSSLQLCHVHILHAKTRTHDLIAIQLIAQAGALCFLSSLQFLRLYPDLKAPFRSPPLFLWCCDLLQQVSCTFWSHRLRSSSGCRVETRAPVLHRGPQGTGDVSAHGNDAHSCYDENKVVL